MLRLAASQSPEIHKRYGTDSSFLDVCSSVPPWFHVDQQAGLEGSGTFQSVRQAPPRALVVLAEDARRTRPGRGEPPLVLERRA